MAQGHATSAKDLCGPAHAGLFLKVSALWFLVAFMFYGQLSLLPFWLQHSGNGLGGVFLVVLGELPVCAVAFLLVERKACGRKRLLMLFSGLEALVALAAYFAFGRGGLLVGLLFANRVFMKGIFCVLYVYTSEVFPTHVRVIGYGWANCVGKASSVAMPFVIFWLYDAAPELPMISFCVCGAACLGVSWGLPFDTRARELDVVPETVARKQSSGVELGELNRFGSEKYLAMHS